LKQHFPNNDVVMMTNAIQATPVVQCREHCTVCQDMYVSHNEEKK
jgi:hypothetical protein